MKKKKKRKSWEAQELSEYNRYWDRSPLHGRPLGMTRESERTVAVHRTSGSQPTRKIGSGRT